MRNFSNTNLICKLKEKINNKLKLDMNVNDQIRYIIFMYFEPISTSESFKLCFWVD